MNVLFSSGQTVEIGNQDFFQPIDNLWGSYGLRARFVGYDLNGYDKTRLFQQVTDCDGVPVPDLNTILADSNCSNSIGWAFTIIEERGRIQEYVRAEEEIDEEFTTGFIIRIKAVDRNNVIDFVERPTIENQVGPILILDIDSIKKNLQHYSNGIAVRIGKEVSGRYVLFLHDRDNETHFPTRIPASYEAQ